MGLQTIYNALRKGGLSRWGALASMGNFGPENGSRVMDGDEKTHSGLITEE